MYPTFFYEDTHHLVAATEQDGKRLLELVKTSASKRVPGYEVVAEEPAVRLKKSKGVEKSSNSERWIKTVKRPVITFHSPVKATIEFKRPVAQAWLAHFGPQLEKHGMHASLHSNPSEIRITREDSQAGVSPLEERLPFLGKIELSFHFGQASTASWAQTALVLVYPQNEWLEQLPHMADLFTLESQVPELRTRLVEALTWVKDRGATVVVVRQTNSGGGGGGVMPDRIACKRGLFDEKKDGGGASLPRELQQALEAIPPQKRVDVCVELGGMTLGLSKVECELRSRQIQSVLIGGGPVHSCLAYFQGLALNAFHVTWLEDVVLWLHPTEPVRWGVNPKHVSEAIRTLVVITGHCSMPLRALCARNLSEIAPASPLPKVPEVLEESLASSRSSPFEEVLVKPVPASEERSGKDG